MPGELTASNLFSLPRVVVHRGRFPAILRAASEQDVLHIGCADAGMHDERLASGDLLHERLLGVARSVVGIDIDETAVAALRQRGIGKVFVADVCDPRWCEALPEQNFDLILVSEVLEHVSNAGLFLSNLEKFARAKRARAFFTVPSAFSLGVLRHLLHNTEFVHPDHSYWFSYHTVTTLLEKHEWSVQNVSAYSFEDTRFILPIFGSMRGRRNAWTALKFGLRSAGRAPQRLAARWLERRSPFFTDGLIIEAEPRPKA